GMSALLYSLAGGLFAFFAMLAAQRSGFGVIGESAAGGVFHNIGQLTAAAIMLGSSAPLAYLPILLPAGAVIGIITGSVCKAVMKKI
ncbi:MAG: Gx transporter family protein, partial [Clostridiales bacterium]|nr:Gx transporter family protein [Clostridiales bacterium]